MKRAVALTLAAVIAIGAACAGVALPYRLRESLPELVPVVFVHATVIDATGAPPQPGTTVVVEGERITRLGPDGQVRVPNGARVIDASGKYLIPGLWDMHVHGALSDDGWSIYQRLLVAHGIVGVRSMDTDLTPKQVKQHLAEPVPDDDKLSPRILLSGRMVNGPGGRSPTPYEVASAAQAQGVVDSVASTGVRHLKVYNLVPRDAYFAVVRESMRKGLPVVGHVPFQVSAAEASDSGQHSIEHLSGLLFGCSAREEELRAAQVRAYQGKNGDRVSDSLTVLAAQSYDPARCGDLLARFKRNRTWQTPTLVQIRRKANPVPPRQPADHRFDYIPGWEEMRGQLAIRRAKQDGKLAGQRDVVALQWKLIGEMGRAGVPILAGSDMPSLFVVPGFGLHDELVYLVEAGLTPMQALQAATLNPARYMSAEDTLGTLRLGKVADMLVLDANPLENIRNTRRIDMVVLRGRVLEREFLDQLLDRARRYARWEEGVRRWRERLPVI